MSILKAATVQLLLHGKKDKIMKKIYAFTLAEMLIVLSIIGVLAIIVLSTLQNSTPDKNKALFKKAYSITERTVAELVNDETLYPYDPTRIGFLNTDSVQVPGTVDVAEGDTKLCKLFTSKLNIFAEPVYEDNSCKFETTDGIYWIMPTGTDDFASKKVITVDVNGKENEPNLSSGDKQDIFTINIYSDGRVNVSGDKEIEYLKSHSVKK